MFTLHLNAISEKDPRVIQPEQMAHNCETKYPEEIVFGNWFRVYPQTGRDVLFLQSLILHDDKFAPATGHGILIAARCMPHAL